MQELPGGGHIKITYRLMRRRDAEACVYGLNEAGEVESYFSTQDDATLEIEIENCSPYDLKHVIATHIGLHHYTDGSVWSSR